MIRLDCREDLQSHHSGVGEARPEVVISMSEEVIKAREQACNYLVVSAKPLKNECYVGTASDRSGIAHPVYSLDIYMAQADWLFDEHATIRNAEKKKILNGHSFPNSKFETPEKPLKMCDRIADLTPFDFSNVFGLGFRSGPQALGC